MLAISSTPHRASTRNPSAIYQDRVVDQLDNPPSIRELSTGRFQPMRHLEGAVCADMHGDLPYGLFVLPNALVRGAAGYIFTCDNALLAEQNASFLRKGKFLPPKFEAISGASKHVDSIDTLVSLRSSCHTYFWHWMMDSLPKVFLAEESGFRGHYLLPSLSSAPWASESMKVLGIDSARLINQDIYEINARELYVPTYFCGYNARFNIEFIKLFRKWVRAACTGAMNHKHRILIGRRMTSKFRRLLNQSAVEEAALEFGFKTVYLEDLPFRSQLELTFSAEALIGPHGSGLTHSLMMDDRSLVVELFPYNRIKSCDCYEMLSCISQHRYRSLESNIQRDGDIELAVDELREVLAAEL